MSDNTTSFVKFIKAHEIQIPLIQRDYVQGRGMNDPRIKEKRDDFVLKLLNAILPSCEKVYTLDFIYGARECYGAGFSNAEAPFLPLDGQQRLTTLFLLHWVLLQINRPKTDEENALFLSRLDLLAKFSYKTRISSGRFCHKLVDTAFSSAQTLVEQIREKYWYDNDMKSDPTIIAMMEMIELMEGLMTKEPYCSSKQQMLDNLFDDETCRINFNLLDMEEYHLTDGLYVKMNARGKELTVFENWKADFIDLLSFDGNLKSKFEYAIEHEWNDVFWYDVYQGYVEECKGKKDSEEKKKVPYPRVDEHFMCFFNNISRLIFFTYLGNSSTKADDFKKGLWATTSSIYKDNRTTVEALFSMLDTLSSIYIEYDGKMNEFFEDLFHLDGVLEWKKQTNKVRLIGEKNTNLFKASYTTDDFSGTHILLYVILLYCSKYKVYRVNEHLCNFVRICRNYLYSHNYFDSDNISIVPQVRANEMYKYHHTFVNLLSHADPFVSLDALEANDDDIEREKMKVAYYQDGVVLNLVRKLEDMTYTLGNLQAFSKVLPVCLNDTSYCRKVWNAMYAFVKAAPLSKVQAFVGLGYQGIKVKKCAYGQSVFIGGQFKDKQRWGVHFRKKSNDKAQLPISNWVEKYVECFISKGGIQEVVASLRPDIAVTPQDYMLKYPDILASQVYWRTDYDEAPFYYAMKSPWKDLDMITIHSFSAAPLNRAYQICPMVNAVVRKLTKFKEYYDKNRIGCVAQGATKGGIIINKDGAWDQCYLNLIFGKKEWLISKNDYENLTPDLRNSFESNDDNYRLKLLEEEDLVIAAVRFMNEVIDDFENRGMLH